MDSAEKDLRANRLLVVGELMDGITQEVGPKLIRLAHLREEARTIIAELNAQKDD